MPRKALKVLAEVKLRAVSCPGVHLSAKDDIYLSMFLMGQFHQSECLPAVFPLLFHEKMTFEKIFRYAADPADIALLLEHETIRIELVQLIPPAGDTLACYEEDARSFLFPEPKLVPSFSGVDREVLMMRAAHFPGIAPRLEFSTKTTITECPPYTEVTIYPNTPLWPVIRRNKRCSSIPQSTPPRTLGGRKSVRIDRERERERMNFPRYRSLSPLRSGKTQNLARLSTDSAPRRPTTSQPILSSWPATSGSASPKHSAVFTSLSSSPLTRSSSTVNRPSAARRRVSSGWQARGTSEYKSSYLQPHEFCDCYVDPIPSELKLCYRELPRYSSVHRSWEELHERVQGLLTTPKAVRRLGYGTTMSEEDEVFVRRSISPGPP